MLIRDLKTIIRLINRYTSTALSVGAGVAFFHFEAGSEAGFLADLSADFIERVEGAS